MIQEYINKALAVADYKILDDGTWFADIKPLSGVWANGESIEETRQALIEVIEEWLLLKLKDGDEIPVLDAVEVPFVVSSASELGVEEVSLASPEPSSALEFDFVFTLDPPDK